MKPHRARPHQFRREPVSMLLNGRYFIGQIRRAYKRERIKHNATRREKLSKFELREILAEVRAEGFVSYDYDWYYDYDSDSDSDGMDTFDYDSIYTGSVFDLDDDYEDDDMTDGMSGWDDYDYDYAC